MRHEIGNLNRKEFKLAALVCVLILAVAAYSYFTQGKTTKKKIQHGNPVVSVYQVNRADMMRRIVLSGQTVANADIALAPRYAGKIVAVNVELGDEVKTGQILLVQDTGDLDISIRQNDAAARAAYADAAESAATYDANYIKMKNNYELEISKYQRNQYLYSIGAISQDTLDSIKQEYASAKAAYEILANQISRDGTPASVESKRFTAEKTAEATNALRKQRDDMIIRAPRDGVIGYRKAEVGELVTAGTKVLSLVDTKGIYVDSTVSESDAAILTTGMPVDVHVDALGRSFKGKIIYVSPSTGDNSHTYTVRILLTEQHDGLKAGMFGRAQLDIIQRASALFVPKEAVLSRNGRTTIFVLNSDNTAEERDVKIGLINDKEMEIIDGVQEGDTVILTNQDKINKDTVVDIAEDK